MSRPNPTSESSAQITVQEAVTATVHHTHDVEGRHVPPKAIAQGMNVSTAHLYEIADESRPIKAKADELPSLVLSSGNFLVLDVIERAVGRVAFAVPACHRAGDVLALTAKAAKEFGAFLQEIATDDADGKWTTAEIARLRRQRDYLFAAVSAAMARAEQAERKGR